MASVQQMVAADRVVPIAIELREAGLPWSEIGERLERNGFAIRSLVQRRMAVQTQRAAGLYRADYTAKLDVLIDRWMPNALAADADVAGPATETVRKLLDTAARIMGLYNAAAVAEAPQATYDLSRLTDAQLAQFRSLAAAAAGVVDVTPETPGTPDT